MTKLEPCSLCRTESSDPRGGLWTEEGFYPLCDGCQPRTWEDALSISARLTMNDAPAYLMGSRFAPDVLDALPTWSEWVSGRVDNG
jgi:hypothetical protein